MTPENMDDLDHALRLAQEQPGGVTHPEITRLREALAAETKARETAEADAAHERNGRLAAENNLRMHLSEIEIASGVKPTHPADISAWGRLNKATITTLRAELAKAREDVMRVQSDRQFIIGFNSGWGEAIKQNLRFPAMLRKMWAGHEVQQWIDDQMADANRARTALASISDGAPKGGE
jgi:hypothetical protein